MGRHAVAGLVHELWVGHSIGAALLSEDDLLVVTPAGVFTVGEAQPVGNGHRVRLVVGEVVGRAEGVAADRGLPRREILALHPLDGGGD